MTVLSSVGERQLETTISSYRGYLVCGVILHLLLDHRVISPSMLVLMFSEMSDSHPQILKMPETYPLLIIQSHIKDMQLRQSPLFLLLRLYLLIKLFSMLVWLLTFMKLSSRNIALWSCFSMIFWRLFMKAFYISLHRLCVSKWKVCDFYLFLNIYLNM